MILDSLQSRLLGTAHGDGGLLADAKAVSHSWGQGGPTRALCSPTPPSPALSRGHLQGERLLGVIGLILTLADLGVTSRPLHLSTKICLR